MAEVTHCWYCESMDWAGVAIYNIDGKDQAVSMASEDKGKGERWMEKHGYNDYVYLGTGKFIYGEDPF